MNRWLVAFLLLTLLSLIGCSNGMSGEKPPKAMIEIGNKKVETTLGTYCWQDDGTGSCVDTVGPVELLKGKSPVKVKPGEDITFLMDYKPKPNEIHLMLMNHEKETEVPVDNNRFTAPAQKGIYYYSYGVWWMDEKEANTSNGDASYVFALEVT